jgi:hypothetical protein
VYAGRTTASPSKELEASDGVAEEVFEVSVGSIGEDIDEVMEISG